MNRRGFIGSIVALAAAPAIVRAESIMRVRPWRIPHLVMRNGILVPSGLVFSEMLFDHAHQLGISIMLPDGKRMAARGPIGPPWYAPERRERNIRDTRHEIKTYLIDWAREQYGL